MLVRKTNQYVIAETPATKPALKNIVNIIELPNGNHKIAKGVPLTKPTVKYCHHLLHFLRSINLINGNPAKKAHA